MNNQLRLAISVSVFFFVGTISFAANALQTSLGIIGTEVDPQGRLHLHLRNDKNAPVCAFSVRYPNSDVAVQEFLSPKQTGILPGATYDFTLVSDTPINESAVVITAVLLTDGIADGSPQDIGKISALRAGRAYRLKEIAPLLESLQKSPDDTFVEDLHRTINAIKSMPLTLEDGNPAKGLFANGMQSAGTLTANELRKAESMFRYAQVNGKDPAQLLDEIITDHNVKIAALEKGPRYDLRQ